MLSKPELERIADEIFADIEVDWDTRNFDSFPELQDVCDANEYLVVIGLWNKGELDVESANAVIEVINDRLAT